MLRLPDEPNATCLKPNCGSRRKQIGGSLPSQPIFHSLSNVARFAAMVRTELGDAHILVNNASGWLTGNLVDAEIGEINDTIDTTIKGPIWMCREFWGQLKRSKPANVINITTLGSRPGRSNATPIYVAAKFGLAGFTDALRRFGIKDGVLVTEILPGSVASNFDLDDPTEDVREQSTVKSGSIPAILWMRSCSH